MQDWDVRDVEPCIGLFECCQEMLPSVAVEALSMQVLMPRLQVEVEAWNPRTDRVPLNLWLHPWLLLLDSKMKVLWTPIRFKLSAVLQAWNPRDPSAHEMLHPWRSVFDPSDWEPLMEKVLVKLESGVAAMSVLPSGHDVGPVQDLLLWLDLVPVSSVAQVLETAFFPRWSEVLQDWLRMPECEFGEVIRWYETWKAVFPSAVREQGNVQRHFGAAVQLMKHVMAGGNTDDVGDARTSTRTAQGKTAPDKEASELPAAEVRLTLSDFLADVASEHGLVFRPKAGQTHLGNQIFQFGAVSVYLDKNLVHVAPTTPDGNWKDVTFDELLRLGRMSVPKRR